MNEEDLQLEKLRESAYALGYTVSEALEEKINELRARSVMACIPNRSMGESEHRRFLHEVISGDPPEWLLDAASADFYSRRNLSPDEKLELEDRQRWRCALCGTALSKEIGPHIDHIVPISMGGSSKLSNLQLLCTECNLGKSNLLSWLLGVPYHDARAPITPRKRYCVLKRDEARCRECKEGPPSTTLHVALRIPQSSGGRYILDNLQTLCAEHYRLRERVLRRRSSRLVSRRR